MQQKDKIHFIIILLYNNSTNNTKLQTVNLESVFVMISVPVPVPVPVQSQK